MADQKPISFADLMVASEPPVSSPFVAANLTPVRYFTPDGLDKDGESAADASCVFDDWQIAVVGEKW